jgi:hypothetical protein
MTRYLLSIHTVEGERREPVTDEDRRESYRRLAAIEREMNSNGVRARSTSGRSPRPITSAGALAGAGEVGASPARPASSA